MHQSALLSSKCLHQNEGTITPFISVLDAALTEFLLLSTEVLQLRALLSGLASASASGVDAIAAEYACSIIGPPWLRR
jgi:hypothetical protein